MLYARAVGPPPFLPSPFFLKNLLQDLGIVVYLLLLF